MLALVGHDTGRAVIFYPFKEAKAGRDLYVQRLEAAMFNEVGVEDGNGGGARGASGRMEDGR